MAELCNSLPCRLCLQKQFQLLPIFPANEPVNDELLRKIYECASVRISYEYDQSSTICIKCIVDVEQFYAFKQRCKETDLMFQKLRQDGTDKAGPEEGECEGVSLTESEFIEPITNLESPRHSTSRTIESFEGPSRLVRIGYNYRIVRVNDEIDVLVYKKHRFYQREPKTDEANKWTCVASASNNCPARITIQSVGYPVALFTKPVRHNHGESIVQMVGTIEPGVEEIIHSQPEFTLVVNSNRRIRFLVGGYRYRLRNANIGGGMSLWCCERSNCAATMKITYEDSPMCIAADEPHCHEVEMTVPTCLPTITESNMLQHKPVRMFRTNGLNYTIVDGTLVSSGNYYKPEQLAEAQPADMPCTVWACRVEECNVKVEILRSCIAICKGNHSHARQITKAKKALAKQTLQQGVNYRLVVEEQGCIRLKHAKQQYVLESLFPAGTTVWACIYKVLGCKATLRMLPDEQMVYSSTAHHNYHEHRVGNAIEQHFLPADAERAPPGTERKLWCTSAYELLWNRNSKPIILRQGHRYYGRTAYENGTMEWHCVRGIGNRCKATITLNKCGEIVAEYAVHDHGRARKESDKLAKNPSMRDISSSPGPARLLAGGFNYRRIHDDHLNVDIVIHVAHKYLPDGPDSKGYHCVLANEPQACPGKITLTNNALCAEIVTTHNHLARTVPKIVEPDRSAQVGVQGQNYELIFTMTGRNCTLLYEGQLFKVYKLVEPSQTSRWRCIHAEVGCKAFLSVPLTLAKPALMDHQPHDHSRVQQGSNVKEEVVDDCMATEEAPPLLRRSTRERISTQPSVQGTLNPTTSDDQSHDLTLSMFQDIRGALIKQEFKPDPDAMTSFLNGHLYVRQFDEMESLDTPEWLCAFHWTLGCNARSSGLTIHTHERFASVRTYDRFNMLKTLISQGLVAQRGAITQMPLGEKVSSYELMPSNGNFSLIIDENRYYFYKAKNNGEWLWRCIRYRWQGCKIGVAVSHCFGKYYYQPYGNMEHVHPEHGGAIKYETK